VVIERIDMKKNVHIDSHLLLVYIYILWLQEKK